MQRNQHVRFGGGRLETQVKLCAGRLPYFVILSEDLGKLLAARTLVEKWLAEMGLTLKAAKTYITHTLHEHEGRTGFDFLGFTVRQFPMANITANGATKSSSNPAAQRKSVTWNRCKPSSAPIAAATKPRSSPHSTRVSGAGRITIEPTRPSEPSIEWITSFTGNSASGPNGKTPAKVTDGVSNATGIARKTVGTFRMEKPALRNMPIRTSSGMLRYRGRKAPTMVIGPTGSNAWDVTQANPTG